MAPGRRCCDGDVLDHESKQDMCPRARARTEKARTPSLAEARTCPDGLTQSTKCGTGVSWNGADGDHAEQGGAGRSHGGWRP
jgi:hypothetical protein